MLFISPPLWKICFSLIIGVVGGEVHEIFQGGRKL
jgi:hypothetical protein